MVKNLLKFLALVVLYILGGKIGLMFYPVALHATLVWPPAGISLAFLILFGTQFWPAIAVGSFFTNYMVNPSIVDALFISLGNSFAIALGAHVFRKLEPRLENALRSFRSVLIYIFLVALPASALAAGIGATALTITEGDDFFEILRPWSIGYFLSHMVLGPFLIKFYIRIRNREFSFQKILEILFLTICTSVACYYVFWPPMEADKYGITFLLFSFLIWAAVRFGILGVSLVTLINSVAAIMATVRGLGPFSVGEPYHNLLFLQFYVGTYSVIGFALAAAISEREMMKGTLKENFNFLQSLTQGVSDSIYVKDRAGKYLFINAYGARVLGSSVKRVLGKTDGDLLPAEISQKVVEIERNVITSGQAYSGEEVMPLGKSKSTFLTKRVPYMDSKNTIVGVLGISRDITDQKLIELERLESENRFRGLANQAPVMIWSAGINKSYDWVNKPWLAFTGRTMEQEIGNGWTDGIHSDDYERYMKIYSDSFDARKSFVMDFRMKHADGKYRWVVDHGVPRYSVSGEFQGYLGSRMDIHDRYQMEISLKEALRVRDEFISIASHELKTPLASLSLQSQIILRQAKAEPIHEQLSAAFKQIYKMNSLIEDLLDVSRIRTGRLKFAVEEFEVNELVEGVVGRLKISATSAGSELRLKTSQPTIVCWDKHRLDQVVTNLITNAIKYGNKKPIEIETSVLGNEIKITVKDFGIGIKPEDQERIFERFERAVSARNFGGLGMGLYIVKQIVSAHGGSVSVQSDLGKGSVFVVSLPIKAIIQEGEAL